MGEKRTGNKKTRGQQLEEKETGNRREGDMELGDMGTRNRRCKFAQFVKLAVSSESSSRAGLPTICG